MTKQLTQLPESGVPADDDLLLIRDFSSQTSEKLPVSTFLERIVENVNHFQSLEADVIANRPSPQVQDRWYLSTDEPALYRDDTTSWTKVLGTATGLDQGTNGTEVATNDQRDARNNSFTGDNSFVVIDVDNINIDGNTISITDTDGDLNLSSNGNGSVFINSVELDLTSGNVGDRLEKTSTTKAEFVNALDARSAFKAEPSGDLSNYLGTNNKKKINFSSEVFDQNNDYSTSTQTFTAPANGIYVFDCLMSMTGPFSTNGHNKFELNLSGNNLPNDVILVSLNPNNVQNADNNRVSVVGHIILSLNSGDTVFAFAEVTGSTDEITLEGNSYFSGYRIF